MYKMSKTQIYIKWFVKQNLHMKVEGTKFVYWVLKWSCTHISLIEYINGY